MDTNQENQEVKPVEPAQPSEIELKAMEMGWKPQEEFDPDSGKEWIPADEFIRRKPLFDKIEAVTRELKSVKQGMEAFKQHHEKVKQTEYQRAMEDLKRQRQEAIEEQDAVKAFEVSDKMRELERSQEKVETTGVNNPLFEEWVTENKWYKNDEDLREFADALGIMYAQKKMSPPDVLTKVSEEVRKKFPEKFRNQNKDRASAVETAAGKPRTPKSTNDDYALSEDERKIMRKIVSTGVMTEAECIKELKRTKGE